MGQQITLYSFGSFDRSGKIRWLAHELGLEIHEERVAAGEHFKSPYIDLNPMAQIPTVVFGDEVLIESTAAAQWLCEEIAQPKLWIAAGEPRRKDFLFWMSAAAETLEGRLVECALAKAKVLPEQHFELHEKSLRFKLKVLCERLPAEGFLCGESLTLADITLGYSLRLALDCDLIARERMEPYFSRLLKRPAAVSARIFGKHQPV